MRNLQLKDFAKRVQGGRQKFLVLLSCFLLILITGCEKSDITPQTDINVSFTPCQQIDMEQIYCNSDNDAITKDFYIFSDDRDEQCGYLLFEDRGSPFDSHNYYVWVENLPQEYQEYLLPVTVIFSYTEDSCNNYPIINILNIQNQSTEENYPIEVPFTEYLLDSLAEFLCQWINFQEEQSGDAVIFINSNEELNNYIECTVSNYLEIDFSKHTLLLAYGIAPSSIVSVNCNSLQQFSEQTYQMEVEVAVGNATVLSNWQLPIIVNKLDEESIIELTVIIKNAEL